MPQASWGSSHWGRWDYLRLVLDQAVDTVLGFRGLRIGDTSNHARVDVREHPSAIEQLARVLIVANIVVHGGTFEHLGAP